MMSCTEVKYCMHPDIPCVLCVSNLGGGGDTVQISSLNYIEKRPQKPSQGDTIAIILLSNDGETAQKTQLFPIQSQPPSAGCGSAVTAAL
jgi:hypothetical protein